MFYGVILNVLIWVDCVIVWCKRSLLDEDMIWREFIIVRFVIEKEFYYMVLVYSMVDLM